MTQTFLHTGENRLVVAGLNMDHAVRKETSLFKAGREEVLLRDAPQHLAVCACSDPSHETCGCRPIHRAAPAAGDLMQTAEG